MHPLSARDRTNIPQPSSLEPPFLVFSYISLSLRRSKRAPTAIFALLIPNPSHFEQSPAARPSSNRRGWTVYNRNSPTCRAKRSPRLTNLSNGVRSAEGWTPERSYDAVLLGRPGVSVQAFASSSSCPRKPRAQRRNSLVSGSGRDTTTLSHCMT